jgi:hypothetical protein
MANTNPTILYANNGYDNQDIYLQQAEQARLDEQQDIANQKATGTAKKKIDVMGILNGIGTAVGSLLGAKQAAQQQQQVIYQQPIQELKKDNTMLWVIGGVVVIGLVVAVYFLIKKKG